MIYETTLISELSPNGFYTIDAGHLIGFPLNLEAGQSILITSQHIAQSVQDHSIRAWVSDELAGRSIGRGQEAMWHPNRTPNETVVVYDAALASRDDYAIATQPGSYVVNFLNLINTRNAVSFSLTLLP